MTIFHNDKQEEKKRSNPSAPEYGPEKGTCRRRKGAQGKGSTPPPRPSRRICPWRGAGFTLFHPMFYLHLEVTCYNGMVVTNWSTNLFQLHRSRSLVAEIPPPVYQVQSAPGLSLISLLIGKLPCNGINTRIRTSVLFKIAHSSNTPDNGIVAPRQVCQ